MREREKIFLRCSRSQNKSERPIFCFIFSWQLAGHRSPCNLSLIIYESLLFHTFYIPSRVSKKPGRAVLLCLVNAPWEDPTLKATSNLYRLIRASILSARLPRRLCKTFIHDAGERNSFASRMNRDDSPPVLIRSRLSHQFELRSTNDGSWAS